MNFHGQQSYMNTTGSGDQLVSMALLEIKHSCSDTNEFLLIYSSTTRFKTSFLTSVTARTSHHYENWVWIPPKINGAEKTRASKGQLCAFQYIHESIKATFWISFFIIFISINALKIYFLPYAIFFNSTIERMLRRGNWRQSHYILTKPQTARIAVSKYCT